jgi:ribonucleoside-triphosphate reductase
MEKFKLSQKFLQNYEGKQPNWGFGTLSYFTYKRTYARIKEDGTQEEFFDTIKRCVEGCFNIQLTHCKNSHLPWDAFKAQKSAQTMFKKMWEFKFLPPGRGLWVMGTPILDKLGSTPLLNCGFISTEKIDKNFAEPFAWAADMLMLGVGIGYDTLGAGKIKILKPSICYIGITEDPDKGSMYQRDPYIIPDTREGWVEALRLLLESYIDGKRWEFDYSLIRSAGSPIKGFGGTASGPEPLKEGLESIKKLLDSYNDKLLDSVGITDIMNYIGKFVVAGNVRRSAEISIGNINDEAFISMKDFKLYPEELKDRRWMSNNSVVVTDNSDFNKVINNIALNGEPGLIFLDNSRKYGRLKDGPRLPTDHAYDRVTGYNPCAEQGLESHECCNLVETFVANHDTPQEYYDTLKYAYLFAKSVTLLPTHCEKTNQIMLQNRRIGCSQSGIQQAIKKFGIQKYLTEFCDKGYQVIDNWDHIYSRWLGIPTSIKMTTVKPSGTVSILAGATPGVHCTHSEYYLRTIRIAANSPLVPKLRKANYRIEESVTDKKTLVVYFPVKESNFTKSKYDISLWEQLTLVKELQHYWSDNAVSCTVTFKPEEIKDLKNAIEYFAPYVKTLSFLPLDNHNYDQAPYQTCTQQEYEDYNNSLLELDLTDEKEEAKGEKYCSNDSCSI